MRKITEVEIPSEAPDKIVRHMAFYCSDVNLVGLSTWIAAYRAIGPDLH